MTGNDAPRILEQSPGHLHALKLRSPEASLGKGAAQVICSHGFKLSQRPGVSQPLSVRQADPCTLSAALPAEIILGPRPPHSKSERVLGVCCSGFRGPRSGREPLGQLSLPWTQGGGSMELTALCHFIFYQRRGTCYLLGYLLPILLPL